MNLKSSQSSFIYNQPIAVDTTTQTYTLNSVNCSAQYSDNFEDPRVIAFIVLAYKTVGGNRFYSANNSLFGMTEYADSPVPICTWGNTNTENDGFRVLAYYSPDGINYVQSNYWDVANNVFNQAINVAATGTFDPNNPGSTYTPNSPYDATVSVTSTNNLYRLVLNNINQGNTVTATPSSTSIKASPQTFSLTNS